MANEQECCSEESIELQEAKIHVRQADSKVLHTASRLAKVQSPSNRPCLPILQGRREFSFGSFLLLSFLSYRPIEFLGRRCVLLFGRLWEFRWVCWVGKRREVGVVKSLTDSISIFCWEMSDRIYLACRDTFPRLIDQALAKKVESIGTGGCE